MTERQGGSRAEHRRRRRQEKKRARELRRTALAIAFLAMQVTGLLLANLAAHDSWSELSGFLSLQPVQILLNLLDSGLQLTRGLRDADAVLLMTIVSLPLNVLFWYAVWRGWRKLRRAQRKRRRAAGAPYGAAPQPQNPWPAQSARPARFAGSVSRTVAIEPTAEPPAPLRK